MRVKRNLILMSLMTSLIAPTPLMAQELNLDLVPDGPGRFLKNSEIKKVREVKEERDRLKLDNAALAEALKDAWARTPQLQWYNEPSIIIGGMVLSFAVGATIVYLIKE